MIILSIFLCHIIILLGTFELHKALQCHLQLHHLHNLLHLHCLLLLLYLHSSNLRSFHMCKGNHHLCSNQCRKCTDWLHSLAGTEGLWHCLKGADLPLELIHLDLVLGLLQVGLGLLSMAKGRRVILDCLHLHRSNNILLKRLLHQQIMEYLHLYRIDHL